MTKYDVNLNLIFAALSDETRRAILVRLSRGPATVGELASHHEMALPSFMGHITKLEAAGMIETAKKGRTRYCRLSPDGIAPAQHWLDQQADQWVKRLDQFDEYALSLLKGKNDEP
ncbi:ArsR/SmtB family transcription factor [Maritalea porphyrae]|uniref:HTH arsR-type domain-containing protein n=1 Tax=Maritalea porphyrae TaxID=880732 RepID=A0ABQ5UNM8_9HYPH|nr:metalloregulator ArsR/SmtB family transcription factor [Maritalea porphyrae]GLQ16893.1 hypothetical protein GCM10007879_11420 [Maritalea porphyrae]